MNELFNLIFVINYIVGLIIVLNLELKYKTFSNKITNEGTSTYLTSIITLLSIITIMPLLWLYCKINKLPLE